MTQIYGNVDEANFKATDIQTFVGILTFESYVVLAWLQSALIQQAKGFHLTWTL